MYGGQGAGGKRRRVTHTFRMGIGAYNIIYSPYIDKPPSNLPLQKMVTGAPDMTLLNRKKTEKTPGKSRYCLPREKGKRRRFTDIREDFRQMERP